MATPAQISFSEEDFKEAASYDELETGQDYTATLTSVEDIVATSTGNPGWGFKFNVKGLTMTTRVYHRGGGKWKIREVFNALGHPIGPGEAINFLDPNVLVGSQCVVTISREDKNDGSGEQWVNIGRHTPLVTDVEISEL